MTIACRRPAFVGLLVLAFAVGRTDAVTDQETDAHTLAMAGKELSAEAAAAVERQLKAAPNDVTARTKLLGYYSLRC